MLPSARLCLARGGRVMVALHRPCFGQRDCLCCPVASEEIAAPFGSVASPPVGLRCSGGVRSVRNTKILGVPF